MVQRFKKDMEACLEADLLVDDPHVRIPGEAFGSRRGSRLW